MLLGCSREPLGSALGAPWDAVCLLLGKKVTPRSGNGEKLDFDDRLDGFAMFVGGAREPTTDHK